MVCREGSDGPAEGSAGAVAARGEEGGQAADVDTSAADRRDTVADPSGHAVGGRSRAVRPVGPGLRPVPPVAARRHLGANPGAPSGPGRRAGSDHLGRERGLDGLPCPPARGRRA
jgi:hypothetical protein